jgi:thiol-disulfide isomerase/thioredoxin
MLRILLFILTFAFFSCSQENEQENQVKIKTDSKPTATDLAKIEVSLLTADGFKPLIDKYHGKILFINLWATWCVPCKEEFPDLVRLKEYYKDADVAIIGISVDFPDEIDTKVKPFLYSQNVNFPNFIQDFKEPEDLINLLNKNWRGAVPTTFIYDQEGHQQKFLLGKHTFEEFKSEIESVRKES